MNTKKFFSWILPMVVFFFLVANRLAAQSDTLSFLHVTDIHLIFNPDILQKDLANDRGHYGFGVTPFDKFLRDVPTKTNADFVAATGDLVDFYEGEKVNHKMDGTSVDQFAQLINENNIPVYATLGNHDITAYSWGDSTRLTTQNVAGAARADWIRNVPCFQYGTYYNRIFDVGSTTYRLIFLDNAFNNFEGNGNYEVPYIDKAQQSWLKSQFEASDKDVEIVIMHIPVKKGASDVKENSIYSVLSAQQTLKMILAGHNHRNVITEFNEDNGQFYEVQTAAFASDREAWRLIRLTENEILVSSPGKTEAEITISVK
jgi:3',5'-cyclic AMP phosphodiesterase CpdA